MLIEIKATRKDSVEKMKVVLTEEQGQELMEVITKIIDLVDQD